MMNAALEILTILGLILLNGVFAMAEIAIVSARRTRLEQMLEEGNVGAEVALNLADTPNRFLSTVQVGITLVGIFAGAFGGATVAQELADLFAPLPVIGPYARTISLVLVVAVITYLSVVIGELVPKRIALQSAERIAAMIARPMHTLSILATPIVRLLSISTDAVLAVLGIRASTEEDVTEEEIRRMVAQSAQAGVIEQAEQKMVEGVFRLGDRTLESIMTPRTEIVWLDANAPAGTNREIIETSNHSRLPVGDGKLDHVLGVVRAKELLTDCIAGRSLDVTRSLEEPLYLPGTMRALRALERFKTSGTHMGLLMDEFGGIDGLVTLIDILEAIVGDIMTWDEIEDPPIVQRQEGGWLVDGLVAIDEFKELFELKEMPEEGTYQTIGGFIVYMLGRIPTAGDNFDWNGFHFEVMDMDGYRVDKVLVDAPSQDEEGDPEDATPA